MKANVRGASVGTMTVAATGYVIVIVASKIETFIKTKDGQMMKSEPFDADPQLKVAFRSVTSVVLTMMRNVRVTGRASVACVKSSETHCDTTDGLTDNSKTTIDCTGRLVCSCDVILSQQSSIRIHIIYKSQCKALHIRWLRSRRFFACA